VVELQIAGADIVKMQTPSAISFSGEVAIFVQFAVKFVEE
jgi:hypothetical protein